MMGRSAGAVGRGVGKNYIKAGGERRSEKRKKRKH